VSRFLRIKTSISNSSRNRTNRAIRVPGAGRLTLPLSMIANKPRTHRASNQARARAKLAIVIASPMTCEHQEPKGSKRKLAQTRSSSPARAGNFTIYVLQARQISQFSSIGSYMSVAETNRPVAFGERKKRRIGVLSLDCWRSFR